MNYDIQISCGIGRADMTPRVRTRKKKMSLLLRVACLMLEIKESRCYEEKVEESERPAVTSGGAMAAQARGVLG